MKVSAIDAGRIESMMERLKSAASGSPVASSERISGSRPVSDVGGFSGALKAALDQVNASQGNAESLGQKFALGDDKVSLSDVMIATQKANISFQATVQVRNKLVSAYHDIMNMNV